jgi:predicted nuclease of predicted toxin-antitoxin system
MSLIRNHREVVKSIDFTGVQNGKIHPTDIDCVLEFDNDILILIETKKYGNEIPTGQRILLERLIDSWHTNHGIALKVEYTDEEIGAVSIKLDRCVVTKYYINKIWYDAEIPCKLVDFINKLGVKWNNEKCRF